MTPLSLRIARTLLFMSGGLAALPPFLILWQSRDPFGALTYVVMFFLAAAAFLAAGLGLGRRPDRAKPLAVSGAFLFGALGTMTGFSLGVVTIPSAGLGVLAAWAALLHPPRRTVLLAFLAYLAIGLVVVLPRLSFGAVWTIPMVVVWPIWILFVPSFSVVPLYGAIAIAAVLAIRALVPPPAFGARRATLPLAAGIGILTAAIAVAAFIGWAYARPDTSARFELAPLVLGFVVFGGLLFGAGVATVRSTGTLASAAALGLGATMLLLAFTYRPAVTCRASGEAQSVPLEWALTSLGSGTGSSGSGSSGTIGPSGERTIHSGEFNYGDRRAVYRCDGATVVEYREVR